MKFCQSVLKILSGNKIFAIVKCHNSGTNERKITCNNPKLDLDNIDAYIKFGEILSVCFKILSGNKILGQIKGHNSGSNLRKMLCDNPNIGHLRNEFNFWNVHGIMNTSGLLQSK